jgi:uncharacterized protein with PIN domain
MVQKTSKVKGDFLRCPECKHDLVEETSTENSTA